MTFIISNKFIFIASFQFLSSSLDSFVKNLSKNDFKSLSQEFDINVLDLVKQKLFYPYECICDFEQFKEELLIKEKLYSSLTYKKISQKEYENVIKVWNKFQIKTMKDYRDQYLKCHVLFSADGFEKSGKNSLKNNGLCPSHYLSPPALIEA